MDDLQACRIQRLEQHPLVLGVGLLLAQQRGLGPAVDGRVHLLHREIRALDQSYLHRGAARGDPPLGEGPHPLHRRGRIRQVRLQHDPGMQMLELGPVQQLLEHLQCQLQVPVLLHVHVEEGGTLGAGGLEVQRQQRLDDVVDGLRRGPQRQMVHQRGDLDREVVDVLALDQLAHPLHPARCLLGAEHRLAEQVDVQRRAVGREAGDRGAQGAGAGIEDQMADHAPHRGLRGGHHGRGRELGGQPAQTQHPAQGRGQEGGRVLRETTQLDRRGTGILGADHAVDEAQRELEPLGIPQQVREHLGRARHGAQRGGVHPAAHLRGDLLDGHGGGSGVIERRLRTGHLGQRSLHP